MNAALGWTEAVVIWAAVIGVSWLTVLQWREYRRLKRRHHD